MKLVLAFIGLTLIFSSYKQPAGLKVGDEAPEIELIGADGNKVKLSSLRGKVVLIDFWASWCGPCRKENPNVVEAYNKYNKSKFKNGKGFEVFSVSLDRDEKQWLKAIEKDGLIWKNHGIDNEAKTSTVYGVNSIPSGFLIDGDGKILAMHNDLRGLGLHIALDNQLK